MGKWLEALTAIDKHDGNEPAKPAKVPFDPFAGSILEHSAREKTQADSVVEENDATNTSTNEPAKAPFDPFAGSQLERSACQKTRSDAETEQFEIANAPTNQPAKPAKDPFDPFAGSQHNGSQHKTGVSATNRASHVSPNAHGKAPAKGPAVAEIHPERQAVAKSPSLSRTW